MILTYVFSCCKVCNLSVERRSKMDARNDFATDPIFIQELLNAVWMAEPHWTFISKWAI